MDRDTVKLIHGEGGKHTQKLIKNIFYKNFKNDILIEDTDSAILNIPTNKIAFTTDSFVVNPIFFRGGDIGKLSICGTINDLTVCGACPLYLSCSFIIEEGFKFDDLKIIVESMAETCKKANVNIVTGDTKVVPKGKVDKIFINTTGIGIIEEFNPKDIKSGDKIILTGTIAEHGTAIAVDRYNLKIKGSIKSDCAPLNSLLGCINKYNNSIKFMRDPTRGGIGEVLNEICKGCGLGIHLFEQDIPIREEVKAINEMLGISPIYLACEGRMVMVVEKNFSETVLKEIKENFNCRASIIGEFTSENKFVYMENEFGGKRILGELDTQILPRIC